MTLVSQQYRAWSDCTVVLVGLALRWWQRLITFGSSRIRINMRRNTMHWWSTMMGPSVQQKQLSKCCLSFIFRLCWHVSEVDYKQIGLPITLEVSSLAAVICEIVVNQQLMTVKLTLVKDQYLITVKFRYIDHSKLRLSLLLRPLVSVLKCSFNAYGY